MFLPPSIFWLEPVIIAAIVVFVIALIGNTLAFGSRVVNALVTASGVHLGLRIACLFRLRQHLHDRQHHTERFGAGHALASCRAGAPGPTRTGTLLPTRDFE